MPLSPDLLAHVAERFRALAEPARLHLLSVLMEGEQSVGALAEATGLGQANASRHLAMLHRYGFVARRKDGLFVHYSISDPGVHRLCDIMCGRVGAELNGVRGPQEPAS